MNSSTVKCLARSLSSGIMIRGSGHSDQCSQTLTKIPGPPPSAALPPVIEWGDFCPRREDMPGHGPHGLVAWRAPGRPMLGKEVDIILNPGDFSKDLNKKGKHRARLLGMLKQSLHLSHGRWEPRTGFNSFPSPRRV